jgi:SAM-dependent methyltransferase
MWPDGPIAIDRLTESVSRLVMKHSELQKSRTDNYFANGPRRFVVSPDPLTEYLINWRLREAVNRMMKFVDGRLSKRSRILVLCAADGYEGSLLHDLGFEDVTVSDISPVAVKVALERDPRLKGIALNAEETGLDDASFDLVVAQDALHHLQRPVQGLTEMLRISRCGVIFFEPHDSFVGNAIGTRWEIHDEARNFVFRWRKKLVEDVASSYFGAPSFENLSFSFWHHNVMFGKLCKVLGGGRTSVYAVRLIKTFLDAILPGMGNQLCGLVVKDVTRPSTSEGN